MLHLDIKTCPTPTTTCRQGIVHNLELRPNQLHGKVHLAPLEQLERRSIQDDLGRRQARGPSLGLAPVLRPNQYRIVGSYPRPRIPLSLLVRRQCFFRRQLKRQRHQPHEVLEAVAAAALDLDAQREVRVRVFGHDFAESLREDVSVGSSGG